MTNTATLSGIELPKEIQTLGKIAIAAGGLATAATLGGAAFYGMSTLTSNVMVNADFMIVRMLATLAAPAAAGVALMAGGRMAGKFNQAANKVFSYTSPALEKFMDGCASLPENIGKLVTAATVGMAGTAAVMTAGYYAGAGSMAMVGKALGSSYTDSAALTGGVIGGFFSAWGLMNLMVHMGTKNEKKEKRATRPATMQESAEILRLYADLVEGKQPAAPATLSDRQALNNAQEQSRTLNDTNIAQDRREGVTTGDPQKLKSTADALERGIKTFVTAREEQGTLRQPAKPTAPKL